MLFLPLVDFICQVVASDEYHPKNNCPHLFHQKSQLPKTKNRTLWQVAIPLIDLSLHVHSHKGHSRVLKLFKPKAGRCRDSLRPQKMLGDPSSWNSLLKYSKLFLSTNGISLRFFGFYGMLWDLVGFYGVCGGALCSSIPLWRWDNR